MASDGIARAPEGEYESFLADVVSAVSDAVEPWRARIAEARAAWSAAGYRVDVLARAMRLPHPPDVDGLLATFASAADHLAALERRASAADPALAGDPAFRDPERVDDAEALVARAMAGARTTHPAHVAITATAGSVADPFFLDEEKVVWDWPDAGGRLIEELR